MDGGVHVLSSVLILVIWPANMQVIDLSKEKRQTERNWNHICSKKVRALFVDSQR